MDRKQRAADIEAAAYQVLAEKGFKGTSMLAVAKAAKASNETLYSWYGDKIGLFAAMIKSNTAHVENELQAARDDGETGLDALAAVSRALLAMVTSDRAVALNRAAAGDPTGALGEVLAREGRSRVAPILAALIEETHGEATDPGARAEVYIGLLIGDLQIRRVIGVLPPLSEAEVATRAQNALTRFNLLYPVA